MLPPSARLLDFIGNSHVRKKLLERLTEGPRTPTELASLESKHVSHVSRALKEMKARGIVEPIRGHSRETYYRMTAQGVLAYAMLSKIT